MTRRHSTEFKVRVVLEALRVRKTMAELGSKHGVHPVQISQWKKQMIDGGRRRRSSCRMICSERSVV